MTSDPLENLARPDQLKPEPPAEAELNGLFLSDVDTLLRRAS